MGLQSVCHGTLLCQREASDVSAPPPSPHTQCMRRCVGSAPLSILSLLHSCRGDAAPTTRRPHCACRRMCRMPTPSPSALVCIRANVPTDCCDVTSLRAVLVAIAVDASAPFVATDRLASFTAAHNSSVNSQAASRPRSSQMLFECSGQVWKTTIKYLYTQHRG